MVTPAQLCGHNTSTRETPLKFFMISAALLFVMTISSIAGEAGWKPLFNGRDLDGWYVFLRDQNVKNQDPNRLVQVIDGAIHMYKDAESGGEQPFGYISTEKEYANYRIRLQYKWGEKRFAPRARAKRDAGLLYHTVGPDKVWPTSVECQIQEGDTGDIWAVPVTRVVTPVDPATTNIVVTVSTNRAGVVRTNRNANAVFMSGGVPFIGTSRVIRNPENEVPGWNNVEVIIRDDTAIHIVNGKTNNLCTDMEAQIDGNWVSLRKGKIVLQLEGAEVLYRNIEIQELNE